MTDDEMALAVGEKILALEHELAAMVGVLDNIIMHDGSRLLWREMVEADLPTLLSSAVSEEKFAALRQAIRADFDHLSALERLHRHFLGNA